jgi:hypothetical protein
MMATTAAEANATSTVAPFCYPVAGFMTAYYYDYRNDDDDNGGTTPPTASSASATGEGGGGAAATTNAIIEAAMRDIVRRGIISVTVGGGSPLHARALRGPGMSHRKRRTTT